MLYHIQTAYNARYQARFAQFWLRDQAYSFANEKRDGFSESMQ